MKALLMELLTTASARSSSTGSTRLWCSHPLADHIKSIARIQLKEPDGPSGVPGLRGGGERGAADKLVHAGFDPVYGARPSSGPFQQKVENPAGPGPAQRSGHPRQSCCWEPTATA